MADEEAERKVVQVETRDEAVMLLKEITTIKHHIRLLSLANCDLENFDVILRQLPSLEWLDLHQNLIDVLPPSSTFLLAKNLKVLNLHNTGIHTVKCLNCLTYCPNLIGLTLYNSPIASKKGYRHHMLNTVLSLKALDHYIASDQELIEEANFVFHDFRPFRKNFRINLLPPSFSEKSLRIIVKKINHVLCHFSPVHIIQRVIRGHLIRRRMTLAGKKFRPMSLMLRGRDLLPAEWKFQKGEVIINYRKLHKVFRHDSPKVRKDFMKASQFPDLHENCIEEGLYGKPSRILDIDKELPFYALKRKQAREVEKKNLAIFKGVVDNSNLSEKADKRASWKHEKQVKKQNREAKANFLQRVSRSIEAAKAVDSAYAIRDRKADYARIVNRKTRLRQDEATSQGNIELFKETYRVNASKARRSDQNELQKYFKAKDISLAAEKRKIIADVRQEKSKRDKDIKWSKENQQKFSEYYIKLEKEIIKYNVRMNRDQYITRCKSSSQRVKEDLELGRDRKLGLITQDAAYHNQYNNRYKARIQYTRKTAIERIEKRKKDAHDRVHTTATFEPILLPYVEPA